MFFIKCTDTGKSFSETLIFESINPQYVLPMFCACSLHGNSMNNRLSYCGLVDVRISASEKDSPVTTHSWNAKFIQSVQNNT